MSEPPSKPPKVSLGAAVMIALAVLAALGLGFMVVPGWLLPQAQVTVVQAGQDLPALTVISTTHLVTATVPQGQARGLVTDVGQAVGRVTTQTVARGASLKSATLLALPPDRWLLSVPISGTMPPAVGETVALLGVQPGADTAALTINDAVVVMVENGVALVALAPDLASRAAPYLAAPQRLVLVRRWR